jgi:hypothetical protein
MTGKSNVYISAILILWEIRFAVDSAMSPLGFESLHATLVKKKEVHYHTTLGTQEREHEER